MKRKFVRILALCGVLALMVSIGAAAAPTAAASASDISGQIIRVGLYYGSDAMDGANLANDAGAGFQFGYYDSANQFIPLASYSGTDTISIVKTENVYYGTVNGYACYYDDLTNSSVAVGCYHLQLDGEYNDYASAWAVAGQHEGGFVAYIGSSYYARVGSYLDWDTAAAAKAALAAAGTAANVVGTSAYGVSVVRKGTNTILFQYDDIGTGTGLGVVPIPAREGEKCTSYFKNITWYGGFRYERIGGGNLTVVNMVELDDYVKGVIPYEMSSSWPEEALKAQAVCARNYALYNLNRHSKYHFDMCNSNDCQVYYGRKSATAYTDAIVDATAGVTATYNGKYINCVYYSSNGGASESSSVVWGSNQSSFPYLVGVIDPYEATVESQISGYRWTRTYTASELTAILNGAGYPCGTIVSARVSAYTETGNPKSVTFTDAGGKNYTLTAKGMMNTFSLRSWRYDFVGGAGGQFSINGTTAVDELDGLYAIDGNGNLVALSGGAYVITDAGVSQAAPAGSGGTGTNGVFTISGAGYGHNVGMSQWGAYAMAKQGYTYDQILKFYYTGITVG